MSGLAGLVVRFNTVENKSNTHLTYSEESWHDFVKSLETPSIRNSKDGPALVPARFKPEGIRRNADGLSHTLLVLDLDNQTGTLTEEAIRHKLDGWVYACHTTFSNTVEKPKWRVIMPIEREMAQEDYEKVYAYFAAIFGKTMDASCHDISRIFFLPACRDLSTYRCWHEDGRVFRYADVTNDNSLVSMESKPKRLSTPEASQQNRVFDYIAKGELHNTFMVIAGTLWAFGLPLTAIGAALKAIPSEEAPTPEHIPHILKEISKKERGNVNIYVYDFNMHHAIITVGGDTKIVREEYDPQLKIPRLVFMTRQSFELAYAYRLDEARSWLLSKHARRYDGIIFDPSDSEHERLYNLWRGFSCEAIQGHCELLLAHLFENVANGNTEYLRWILNWMAATVQKPGEAIGTAIVLRGGQGTGKSLTARLFGELFGSHFAQISNRNQLVGNFTSSIVDKVVVVAEEAFFAGDRLVEGRLKALVTEPYLVFEEKYLKPFTVKNCIHLMMCSNHEWVVPTGTDERRFAIFDMSTKNQQNHKYFGALMVEYESGGKEAFLHYLSNFKVDFELVRRVPHTKGLAEHKILSLERSTQFLLQHLLEAEEGKIYRREELFEQYLAQTRDTYSNVGKLFLPFTKAWGKQAPYGPCQDYTIVRIRDGDLRKEAYKYLNIQALRESFAKYVSNGRMAWFEVLSAANLYEGIDEVLPSEPPKTHF